MDQQTEVLTEILLEFLSQLRTSLPRREIDKLKLELAGLNDRLGRVERSLSQLEPGLIVGKPSPKIKRVSLKDRVIRLVSEHPEGIETVQVSLSLGVTRTNVSRALGQAAEEGLILKEKRGLYRPRPK